MKFSSGAYRTFIIYFTIIRKELHIFYLLLVGRYFTRNSLSNGRGRSIFLVLTMLNANTATSITAFVFCVICSRFLPPAGKRWVFRVTIIHHPPRMNYWCMYVHTFLSRAAHIYILVNARAYAIWMIFFTATTNSRSRKGKGLESVARMVPVPFDLAI